MATAGPLFPSTTANDPTGGSFAWTSPANIGADDSTYASSALSDLDFALSMSDRTVRIIKADGSIGSTNKGLNTTLETVDTVRVYGSPTDLWGETLTPADINDPDFGVVLSCRYSNLNGTSDTQYLKATNFGFSIPTTSTIQGIVASIELKGAKTRPGFSYISTITVDRMTLTVYYTNITSPRPAASIINAVKVSFAELWSTITSSWATETRSWVATNSLITDTAKPSTTITNVSKPS